MTQSSDIFTSTKINNDLLFSFVQELAVAEAEEKTISNKYIVCFVQKLKQTGGELRIDRLCVCFLYLMYPGNVRWPRIDDGLEDVFVDVRKTGRSNRERIDQSGCRSRWCQIE